MARPTSRMPANRCTVSVVMERDTGDVIEVDVSKASSSKSLAMCLDEATKAAIAQAHAAASVPVGER